MVYEGHVEKGVVVVDGPVTLPDGARVKVEVLPRADRGRRPSRADPVRPTGAAGRRGQGAAAGLGPQPRPLPPRAAEEMNAAFADTYYYLALFSESDSDHQRAVESVADACPSRP